jgi:hypothetical protein
MWFLFILFLVIWVASVVIIIYSLKCSAPEPNEW